MKNHSSIKRSWLANLSTLTLVCVGFAFLTIPIMFFEADLGKFLTSFLEPFFLLLFILIYLILFISSILYIPLRIKKRSDQALLPLVINAITFFFVFFMFIPFHNLRMSVEFLAKKDRFNEVILWVEGSIQNGSINLDQDYQQIISLPNNYINISDGNRVLVKQDESTLSVFFFFGGGMFEYYPGFMYRSDNNPPPIENRDIECFRKIKPHWYYCS